MMRIILGPNIPGLRKLVRKQKTGLQPDIVTVPQHIQDYYQEIILAINVIHVNQISFLVTTLRHMHYHTATAMKEVTTQIMVYKIQRLVSFYRKRKFDVKEILVDGQFHSSRTALARLQINLSYLSMDEHVPEAKRLIWTLNEPCRCSLHNTTFPKLPKQMVI